MAGLPSSESQRAGEVAAGAAGSLYPEVYRKGTVREQSLVSRPAVCEVSYLPASACPDQEPGDGSRRKDARGKVHSYVQERAEVNGLDLGVYWRQNRARSGTGWIPQRARSAPPGTQSS